MLEQARKVMSTLEPLEREVLVLKFGLPPEYCDEFDKIWNIENVCMVDEIYTIYGGIFWAKKSVTKVAQGKWFGNDFWKGGKFRQVVEINRLKDKNRENDQISADLL